MFGLLERWVRGLLASHVDSTYLWTELARTLFTRDKDDITTSFKDFSTGKKKKMHYYAPRDVNPREKITPIADPPPKTRATISYIIGPRLLRTQTTLDKAVITLRLQRQARPL